MSVAAIATTLLAIPVLATPANAAGASGCIQVTVQGHHYQFGNNCPTS
jgi:hypothetical protein